MKKLFLFLILILTNKIDKLNAVMASVSGNVVEIPKQIDAEIKQAIEQLDVAKVKKIYSQLKTLGGISESYLKELCNIVEKMRSDLFGTKFKNFSRIGIGATFALFSANFIKNLFIKLRSTKDITYDYKISKVLIKDYFHGDPEINQFSVPLFGFSLAALISGIYQIKKGFDTIKRAKSDKVKAVNKIYDFIHNQLCFE